MDAHSEEVTAFEDEKFIVVEFFMPMSPLGHIFEAAGVPISAHVCYGLSDEGAFLTTDLFPEVECIAGVYDMRLRLQEIAREFDEVVIIIGAFFDDAERCREEHVK